MKAWKKFSPKSCRGSIHVDDPVIDRQCAYCMRIHKKRMSATAGGKPFSCRCGAVFSSTSVPQWSLP